MSKDEGIILLLVAAGLVMGGGIPSMGVAMATQEAPQISKDPEEIIEISQEAPQITEDTWVDPIIFPSYPYAETPLQPASVYPERAIPPIPREIHEEAPEQRPELIPASELPERAIPPIPWTPPTEALEQRPGLIPASELPERAIPPIPYTPPIEAPTIKESPIIGGLEAPNMQPSPDWSGPYTALDPYLEAPYYEELKTYYGGFGDITRAEAQESIFSFIRQY